MRGAHTRSLGDTTGGARGEPLRYKGNYDLGLRSVLHANVILRSSCTPPPSVYVLLQVRAQLVKGVLSDLVDQALAARGAQVQAASPPRAPAVAVQAAAVQVPASSQAFPFLAYVEPLPERPRSASPAMVASHSKPTLQPAYKPSPKVRPHPQGLPDVSFIPRL